MGSVAHHQMFYRPFLNRVINTTGKPNFALWDISPLFNKLSTMHNNSGVALHSIHFRHICTRGRGIKTPLQVKILTSKLHF